MEVKIWQLSQSDTNLPPEVEYWSQELSAAAVFGRPESDGGLEKILAGFSIKKEEHHDPKN